MPEIAGYNRFGSVHWESGAPSNILAHYGWEIPEALLFGLGGGIGFAFFAAAHKDRPAELRVHTRYGGPRYDPVLAACEALGLRPEVRRTTKPARAREHLDAALEAGRPVIAWADAREFGYNGLTERPPYTLPVVVYAVNDTEARVSDRSRVPLVVPADELAAARAAGRRRRNRMLSFPAPGERPDPGSELARALVLCKDVLLCGPDNRTKSNYGLRGLDRLAQDVGSRTGARSWARVFSCAPGLCGALVTLHEAVELYSAGGGAGRALYADFLEIAHARLGKPELSHAAGLFRKADARWRALAAAALSTHHLARWREARLRARSLFLAQGGPCDEQRALAAEMERELRSAGHSDDVSRAWSAWLAEELRDRVSAIRELELEAALAIHFALPKGRRGPVD